MWVPERPCSASMLETVVVMAATLRGLRRHVRRRRYLNQMRWYSRLWGWRYSARRTTPKKRFTRHWITM